MLFSAVAVILCFDCHCEMKIIFFYEWKSQCNVLNLPYPLKPAHSQFLFLLICVNVVVSPVQF